MRFAVPGLLGLGLLLTALPPRAAAADPFAASVLSCAAEADRDRRLDCYDRAVANFTAALSRASDSRAGVPVTPSPAATAPAAQYAAPASAAATAASQPATGSVATTTGQPAATATGQAAAGSAAPPRHVTARVVSVDYVPDHMVVHLDNNQVWQQVAEASTELHFKAGDTVNIDKQMGSYWLSGRKGDGNVQVKQKQ